MFHTIEAALEDLKAGKMIVVVDDEDRENEGDLLMVAEKVTPEAIAFMAREGCGLICVPIEEDLALKLDLSQMVQDNTDPKKTAFTVSVDAKSCGTGISAFDRAMTIQAMLDPEAKGEDFSRPGHVFPLIARKGGVLRRAGHTEAAVDLAKLAGARPAGVICEIMGKDGHMAKGDELWAFAQSHELKIITIESLIAYQRIHHKQVRRRGQASLPSKYGSFEMFGYEDILTGQEHVALVKGKIDDGEPVLVRVHSECLTGDALGSLRCDCGDQLAEAAKRIEEEGRGILLYMRQEGRGIGLLNKIEAYSLQDQGLDTVEANHALGFDEDLREYGIGAQILQDLGVKKLILMTNNPKKVVGLSGHGIEVTERQPLVLGRRKENEAYFKTKEIKMGHIYQEEEKI